MLNIPRGGGKLTVMEVYKRVLAQAQMWRDLERSGKKPAQEKWTAVEVYGALATEMYTVAANLEYTEEINPSK